MTWDPPCNCDQALRLTQQLDEARALRDGAYEIARAANARAEGAIAACAEMRAALGAILRHFHEDHLDHVSGSNVGSAARALLARTDLGAGMVAVPREVVERALSEHEARVGECNCGICYPLRAVLKKGGA